AVLVTPHRSDAVIEVFPALSFDNVGDVGGAVFGFGLLSHLLSPSGGRPDCRFRATRPAQADKADGHEKNAQYRLSLSIWIKQRCPARLFFFVTGRFRLLPVLTIRTGEIRLHGPHSEGKAGNDEARKTAPFKTHQAGVSQKRGRF